jgi:TPR repeat protein
MLMGWFRRGRDGVPEVPEPDVEVDASGKLTAQSLEAIKKAAKLGHVVSMANLGIALHQAGQPTEGFRWLNKALAAGNAGAGFNLGVLYQQAGDSNRAQVVWERSAGLGDPDAMLGLVKQALERRDRATVERWAPLIHAQQEAFPITALGVAFHAYGDEAEALRAFRRAEELGDAYAMEYRARLLDLQGEHGQAEALRARAATAQRMM